MIQLRGWCCHNPQCYLSRVPMLLPFASPQEISEHPPELHTASWPAFLVCLQCGDGDIYQKLAFPFHSSLAPGLSLSSTRIYLAEFGCGQIDCASLIQVYGIADTLLQRSSVVGTLFSLADANNLCCSQGHKLEFAPGIKRVSVVNSL